MNCGFSIGDRAIVVINDDYPKSYWTIGRELTIYRISNSLSYTFLHEKSGKNCYAKNCKRIIKNTKIARKLNPDFKLHEKGWIIV